MSTECNTSPLWFQVYYFYINFLWKEEDSGVRSLCLDIWKMLLIGLIANQQPGWSNWCSTVFLVDGVRDLFVISCCLMYMRNFITKPSSFSGHEVMISLWTIYLVKKWKFAHFWLFKPWKQFYFLMYIQGFSFFCANPLLLNYCDLGVENAFNINLFYATFDSVIIRAAPFLLKIKNLDLSSSFFCKNLYST